MADYSKCTVAELRQVLKARNIPPTGLKLKHQIVEALEQWDRQNAESDNSQASQQALPLEINKEESPETLHSDPSPAETAEAPTTDKEDPVETTQSKLNTPSIDVAIIDPRVSTSAPSLPHTPVVTSKESPLEQDVAENAVDRATQPSVAPTLSRLNTEELAEETRKRKRRSATPPIGTAEATKKKQRIDEELGGAVHLKEDSDVDVVDARKTQVLNALNSEASARPEPVNDEGVSTQEPAISAASYNSDADMDMDASEVEEETAGGTSIEKPLSQAGDTASSEPLKDEPNPKEISAESNRATASPTKVIPNNARYKTLFSTKSVEAADRKTTVNTQSREVTRALHPASTAIYIRNFTRPLQPQVLRSHLIALATPPGSSPNSTLLQAFYLDPIRTHAFAIFTSMNAASRVRAALHEIVWPAEKTRKPLFVDFVPEEAVENWIETEEIAAREHGRMARRWEVTYRNDKAFFGEAGTSGAPLPGRRLMHPNDFNPPTGPRNDYEQRRPSDFESGRSSDYEPHRTGEYSESTIHPSRRGLVQEPGPARVPPPRVENPATQRPFQTLDQMFSKTKAKPFLYFLSVEDKTASARLEEIRHDTSRDWDGRIKSGEELRKLVFDEDGRIVDNGPLFNGGGGKTWGLGGRGRGRLRGRGG
ncbi:hypothetical protein EJ05DRAFT_43590 [Pseudovirgaria hyperparasitica]|uniref:SAP domain-containing protein n=1 Tax=Pseudovirgaria hyperparasitica TaxID=470096 RepID=A0A6A6WMX4_9PEZI|nr:uncharacterized protein EJ05DRAFT_43590 [Pseudovirgaria hyperparasitica]KAF2763580.1 hypothetical protein EJ05DRAFT_43590 [Pseudovirgaria hyperparasitica]